MGGPTYIYPNQFCGKSKRCQISLSTLLLIALIVHRGDLRNFELDLLGSCNKYGVSQVLPNFCKKGKKKLCQGIFNPHEYPWKPNFTQ